MQIESFENRNISNWITGCKRKQQSSQLALYRHFYSYGLGICLRYSRTRESALEMLNDGFLRVFLKIDQYDKNQPFKPWLRRVLVNAAIDHYRKYKSNVVIENAEEELAIGLKHRNTYNEALDNLEFDDLSEAIQNLPSSYRVVFNLYAIEGFSHREIAEKLNISIGSSKANLIRARRKIKLYLNQLWTIQMAS